MSENNTWKSCSTCKKPIAFGARYWACSVSTCNRSRLAQYFCSMTCWDAHLPVVRHRSAHAIEKRAPSRKEYEEAKSIEEFKAAQKAAKKNASAAAASQPQGSGDVPMEVLVVASRAGAYVEERAELRLDKSALYGLSHLIRRECDLGITAAAEAGRKTVLDRDLMRPPAGTRDEVVLVVVSKMKGYIKAKAGMNTGGTVADMLSAHVRGWLNHAVREARAEHAERVLERHLQGL